MAKERPENICEQIDEIQLMSKETFIKRKT